MGCKVAEAFYNYNFLQEDEAYKANKAKKKHGRRKKKNETAGTVKFWFRLHKDVKILVLITESCFTLSEYKANQLTGNCSVYVAIPFKRFRSSRFYCTSTGRGVREPVLRIYSEECGFR